MNYGAISADIIGSTTLAIHEKEELLKEIKNLIKQLEKQFKLFGRIVKGDQIECIVSTPSQSLRIALIIKCFIKSKTTTPFYPSKAKTQLVDTRNKYFRVHGVRMAIAIGEMIKVDKRKGVIDGEAIYLAGRAINEYHTSNKERVVIKNTIFFISNQGEWQNEFDVTVSLIDILISKCTARQSEILVHKLLGKREDEISKELNISQSAVNQNANAAGWNGISKAIDRFEKTII